jgi:hypothetical protein
MGLYQFSDQCTLDRTCWASRQGVSQLGGALLLGALGASDGCLSATLGGNNITLVLLNALVRLFCPTLTTPIAPRTRAHGFSVEDAMPHEEYKLTAADPRDLAESVALALRFFEGRKRNHDADAFRANIAAERVVRHLERAGFVVMKKPPGDFGAGTGFSGSARPAVIRLAN